MKIIKIDDELYQFIASKTENIGEQASDILRRLLGFPSIKANDQPVVGDDQAVDDEKVPQITSTQPQTVAGESLQSQPPIEGEIAEKSGIDDEELKVKDPQPETEKPLTLDDTQDSSAIQSSHQVDVVSAFQGVDFSEITAKKTVVKRFMHILTILEQKHQQDFACVLNIQGRDRRYFATSEIELTDTGLNTNPKLIGNSSYWVMTNSSTERKRRMLGQVMRYLGYSQEDIDTLLELL